ncbi:hypothetical protein J6590_067215 [Homalodisca vitripennis]|nr:hypothetical protein J6590_067215 [Homalodisca vitripennis]
MGRMTSTKRAKPIHLGDFDDKNRLLIRVQGAPIIRDLASQQLILIEVDLYSVRVLVEGDVKNRLFLEHIIDDKASEICSTIAKIRRKEMEDAVGGVDGKTLSLSGSASTTTGFSLLVHTPSFRETYVKTCVSSDIKNNFLY